MFVSFFKNVSHYCFMRWGQKFRKCTVFFFTETTKPIHSTICVPLNCEPKIIRTLGTLGLLLITESRIASPTCYSFHALILSLSINQI